MKHFRFLHLSIICFLALIGLSIATPCFANAAPAKASIVVDEKGEEWIRIPKEGNADQLVRVVDANEQQILEAFGNFDFKSIPGQSLKQFGPEYIKFSAALMVVQMSTCFGTTSSLAALSPISSPASPTCVDDFLTHLVDWKGWVGFYFFMLGNRYTSTGMMKIATISLAYVGKTKSIPELRRKLAPFLGYLGMTGGSLASQVVHHFLSAPSWGQCISLMKTEGLTSVPCKEAFTHFLSVEDFWDDFAAASMAMITATVAATVTQSVFLQSTHLLSDSKLLARRGVRVLGGNSKAIQFVARHGSKVIDVLRVGKNLTVATGVPGVVVLVVTQVGQFALFLAWDEALRNPFSRGYYDWETSGGVNSAILNITAAAKENQKLEWKKPYVIITEKCTHRTYNRTTKKMESVCSKKYVDPLMSNLAQLNYGAQRYRKKVLQNPIDMAIQGWTGKMEGVLQKYKISKTFIEYISKERAKNESRALTLAESSVYILFLWKNSLEFELSQHPYIPKNVKPLLVDLATALGVDYEKLEVVKRETTPSRTNYYTPEIAEIANTIKLTAQQTTAVKNALEAIKLYTLNGLKKDSPLPGVECNHLPLMCLARDTTQTLNLQNIEISKTSSESFFDVVLFHIFGTEKSTTTHNVEFTNAIYEAFRVEQAVADTAFEMLCGQGKDIVYRNTGNNGRKATLTVPMLIDFEIRDLSLNCYDYSSLRGKFDISKEDILRPWIVDGRIYPTALDMLSSKNISLISGRSSQELNSWWFEKAFKPMSQFLFTMAKEYQTHLNENFFAHLDDYTPEQLVHVSQPQMRGGALDYKIVSFPGLWERPTLSMSLMAQVNFVLDTAKYYGPSTQDSKKYDALKIAFARYILNLKEVQRLEPMEKEWAAFSAKINSAQSDNLAIGKALETFDTGIQEAVLSKERLQRMVELRAEVIRLRNELFFEMSGRSFETMSGLEPRLYKARAQREIEDFTQHMSISEKENKQFTSFILVVGSLDNIIFEIGKLYDNLGAKPFFGM